MTEKRYVAISVEWTDGFIQDHEEDNDLFGIGAVVDCLNEQDKTIKQLQSEIKMLKTTIGRNEAYIDRLLNAGEWNNTSKEVEWEQKFYNLQEMLNAERKDKERVIQANQDLTDKLNKLQGENNDSD